MENVNVINIMRSIRIADKLDLEHIHRTIGGKLYRGRPEMLILTMSNGRHVQLFRRGTVQILGRLRECEAQDMRQELLQRLQIVTTNPLLISNIVVRAQLKNPLHLQKITQSNGNVFYEIELFPAVLIRKWHPAHIALFHNGKLILTGIKSVDTCQEIFSHLLDYLRELNSS